MEIRMVASPVAHLVHTKEGLVMKIRNTLMGELMAEFLGTLVLLAFGDGVVASFVTGRGDVLMITFAWGLAVVMGVYVAGGLSGAHLNPAVTIALASRGDLAWGKVGPYILAQLVGAFCGAGLVLIDMGPQIDAKANSIVGSGAGQFANFTDARNSLDGIFFTHPAASMGVLGGLVDQIIGTALLLFLIRAITDTRNSSPIGNMAPFIIGLAIVVIGQSFGAAAGYAINPARDFGPRLLASIGGWGANPFTDDNGYFWVPIVAPIIGGIIGIFAYDFGIKQFLIAKGDQPLPAEESKGETVRQR